MADRHNNALILILALSLCLRGEISDEEGESDNSDSELVTVDCCLMGVLQEKGDDDAYAEDVVLVVGCESLFLLMLILLGSCCNSPVGEV